MKALTDLRWDRWTMAAMVARDIPDGWCVNLGIGMPTDVADLVGDREVVFHSENGVVGVGPRPAPADEDPDLVNAGKEPVTIVAGGSFLSHCDSFALIRGGHVDLAVMGAFQVSAAGDLANWTSGADAVPAVGGAMDLAVGARQVWVMMSLQAPDGTSKLVPTCTYPLTAAGVVRRAYTDVAVFSFGGGGAAVEEAAEGLTVADLVDLTGTALVDRTSSTKGSAWPSP